LNSDIQLMLKVKSGDLDKLGILFERHKNAIYSYFYRNTFDKNACDDLSQNVFYRILIYRSRFDGYGKFSTWMYRIAHNVLVDHYQKNKPLDIAEGLSESEHTDKNEADSSLLEDEQQQLLVKAIRQLPVDQREALIMSRYQGLKYKEIAEIQNCNEGNIKVRIFRALTALKEIYLELET